MSKIDTIDLQAFVGNAVNNVFDTMLSMDLALSGADQQQLVEGHRFSGSVSFAGDINGNVNIHVKEPFARMITAAMLGMEVDEIEDEDEVCDVIGEMSNMIGGSIKSHLCDSGFPCELSIPSITSGSDYKIESIDWVRHEQLAFQHQQHIGLVEIYIKSGS